MPRAKASRLDTEPDLLDRLAQNIRRGLFPERAAIAAGIPSSTHYEWQRKGRDERDAIAAGRRPRKTYASFLAYVETIERAGVDAEAAALDKIAAADPGWEAAAWLLERRFPDAWGARSPDRQGQTGAPKGPVPVPQPTGLQELQRFRAERQRHAQE